MSSAEAQKQRILKLNIKDKKLTRLFSYSDLSAKDSLFINYAYQEKQLLFFKYSVALSLITAMVFRKMAFKINKGITANTATVLTFFASHLFWSNQINKRFNKLIDPYFQKYGIK